MPGYSYNLQHALGFTSDDLEANRNGYLTDRQQEMLAERRRLRGCSTLAAVVTFMVSAALLVLAPLFFGGTTVQNADTTFREVLPYTLMAAGILLGTALIFTVTGYVRSSDLTAGKISVIEGKAKLSTRYFSKIRMPGYYVTVGGVRFQVQKGEIEAFIDGDSYRVYYVKNPPIEMVLSAEML
ncbi:MAG TPA: hypothetical protein VJ183_00490 [Chloroflexia bacterium]|nr:hypothetical protein [Chloroflexia bacterium]